MRTEINARDGADRDAFQKVEGFGRLNHYDRARLGGVGPFDRDIDNIAASQADSGKWMSCCQPVSRRSAAAISSHWRRSSVTKAFV